MKKTIIALLLSALSCSASVALAANPFDDVPAKHWAYDAVNKLAKAGIVDGTGFRQFQGDKPLTRYEMAQIVGKAISNAKKADANNEALITKLSTEFAEELKNLGVRVKTLEDKEANRLKISGFGFLRHEWVKNPRAVSAAQVTTSTMGTAIGGSETRAGLGLMLDQKFDDKSSMHVFLVAENMGGNHHDNQTVKTNEAYYTSKAGDVEWAAGKFTPFVGQGLLWYVPGMDGARVSFGKDVKTTLYTLKSYSPLGMGDGFGNTLYHDAQGNPVWVPNKAHSTWHIANQQIKLSNNTSMTLGYINDADEDYYRSGAVGLTYTGVKNLKLYGEYGRNTSDNAKGINSGSAPNGMYIKAKYKGANPFVPGSAGFWAMYKKGDNGFDVFNVASRDDLAAPYNWTIAIAGGSLNDVKGYELGFEVTVAPRAMLQVRYDDLEAVNTSYGIAPGVSVPINKEQKYLISQLTWIF